MPPNLVRCCAVTFRLALAITASSLLTDLITGVCCPRSFSLEFASTRSGRTCFKTCSDSSHSSLYRSATAFRYNAFLCVGSMVRALLQNVMVEFQSRTLKWHWAELVKYKSCSSRFSLQKSSSASALGSLSSRQSRAFEYCFKADKGIPLEKSCLPKSRLARQNSSLSPGVIVCKFFSFSDLHSWTVIHRRLQSTGTSSGRRTMDQP
mmetsp:Transcript_49869/g.97795  ORF Transcript_49869/g.97795 Transcript_49869/m.97795 type:complete len:207 (-) Transcript_49869:280-900(-)